MNIQLMMNFNGQLSDNGSESIDMTMFCLSWKLPGGALRLMAVFWVVMELFVMCIVLVCIYTCLCVFCTYKYIIVI